MKCSAVAATNSNRDPVVDVKVTGRKTENQRVPGPSSEAVSRRMSATGQRDTRPEKGIRKRLFARGLRYRVDYPVLGKPRRRGDIVFPGAKVAVFVDGCFWHGCPVHGTWPKENAEFWRAKIEANRARDADTNRRLEALGWTVVRVWAHEDAEEAAERVARIVEGRRRKV